MKRTAILVLAMLLLVVPLTALAETMYVNTPNGGSVNLRVGPSADDEVLTSVGYGEPVQVIEMLLGSNWVNVSYNGYYGYISMRYLSDYPPSPVPTFVPAPTQRPTSAPTARPSKAPSPTAKPSGETTLEKALAQMFTGFTTTAYDVKVVPSTPTTYVNMRWAPSKSAPVRAQYWADSVLHVISTNGTWSEVYDEATNTYGFIMSNFLRPVAVGADGSDS